MDEKILLVLTGEDELNAEETAFNYARANSKKLVVLQILTSNLYHYGHQDIIATRPSKRQFLLHIREEVLERGKAKAKAMAEKAQEEGIALEILSVESEDVVSTAARRIRERIRCRLCAEEEAKTLPVVREDGCRAS